MVAAVTSTPAGTEAATMRKQVRVDGDHSLSDVARIACGDVRLSPLLADLNPALPSAGLLAAGTIVVCPRKDEARAFAQKMGFTLGFDPSGANGTDARRRWAAHRGDATPGTCSDAVSLARALMARGVGPGEAARRIIRQCRNAEVERLITCDDESLQLVARAAEVHALFPKATVRLAALRSLLDATARPAGLRVLLDAAARDPVKTGELLAAAAVAPALRTAILEEAPRIARLLKKAQQLAGLERGARDVSLQQDADAEVLGALVHACVDSVEPLAGGRVAALGIEAEIEALMCHLDVLRSAFRQAEDGLGQAPVAVLRALVGREEPTRLPKPWPLLVAVCLALTDAMEACATTVRDRGVGALVPHRGHTSAGGSLRAIPVAVLRARALPCARAADEGVALVQRLAPAVAGLFKLMRPSGAMEGSPRMRKARDRLAFDVAVAGVRGGVTGDGIAALTLELVERARHAGLTSTQRLTPTQLESLARISRGMAGQLAVARHTMSELGRALVLVAMASDRELGLLLLRPTGEEAFLTAAARQAGRIISAAAIHV